MDIHTATEQAFKNGYEKGKEEAAKQLLITAIKLSDVCQTSYEFQNILFDYAEKEFNLKTKRETIIGENKVKL